jgi:F-type H+-transporting ATPase subunit a
MNISLAAEPVFHLGHIPITNSLINGFLAVIFFIALAYSFRGEVKAIPKGLQNFLESIMEIGLSYIDRVTHNRQKSMRFLPVVLTLFLFILFSNWLGQLPGTGTFGIWEEHAGEKILIPFLRPATSDINTTLALAVFAVIATHIFGIITIGFFRHFNKFINLGGIFKSIKLKKPVGIFVAIVEFFVGLIEFFSEIAKMVSLSLRLFGNVFAGEVLLTVMASLVAYLVPLPFIFLELLVGFIQATIFAMLTLVFLEVATVEHH